MEAAFGIDISKQFRSVPVGEDWSKGYKYTDLPRTWRIQWVTEIGEGIRDNSGKWRGADTSFKALEQGRLEQADRDASVGNARDVNGNIIPADQQSTVSTNIDTGQASPLPIGSDASTTTPLIPSGIPPSDEPHIDDDELTGNGNGSVGGKGKRPSV
jgi:hypothetical protein